MSYGDMSYGQPGFGDPATQYAPARFDRPERQHSQTAADWKRRGLLVVAGVALLLLGWLIATSFLPRWWSQTVGDMSNHTFRWGIWWGLFFGFVSTFVPLLVARTTWTRAMQWKTRGWILLIAVLLSAPNLMTLGIVVGTGNGAHAGERTLDTAAPGFRGATLVAAIIAVIAMVGVEIFLAKHRHQRRELTQLRVEEKLRRAHAA